MDLQLSFAQGEGYLFASVAGVWTADGVVQVIYDIAGKARDQGSEHVLLDVTGMSGPVSDFHRFLAGEEIARAFDDVRLAIVASSHTISKMTEETAYGQGADLRVVSDFDTALRWLLGPEEDTTSATARS